jgi:hypothetical protein
MATMPMETAHTVKRQWQRRPLSAQVLSDQNRHFRRTGGVSQENQAYGFLPAFMDTRSGAIYLSCFADGRFAPIHLLEGLPEHLIAARTGRGAAIAASGSVIAGFVREERFYTREEAAKALHRYIHRAH